MNLNYEHIFEQIYNETHIFEVRKKTTEEFVAEAKLLHPEYDYSKVNYVNNKTKVTINCPKHGDFLRRPDKFLGGKGCPTCGQEKGLLKIKLTTEKFIAKAKQMHPEYDYSKVNYVDYDKEVIISCPKHGDFKRTPKKFLLGFICQRCKKELILKKNEVRFVAKAKQIHPEYDYSKVNYVGSDKRVLIGCPKHGYVPIKPESILQGYGCPVCAESKGEMLIRGWFEKHKINYKYQHRFADLKRYPYDFYIPDFNLLIEYNGIQHYEEKPFFHRKPDSFNGQLMRDFIKKDYAEENGYDFLVIPYWQYKDIEKILSEKLLST